MIKLVYNNFIFCTDLVQFRNLYGVTYWKLFEKKKYFVLKIIVYIFSFFF